MSIYDEYEEPLDEVDRQYKERYGMTPHEEFLHNQARFNNLVCNEKVVEKDIAPDEGEAELSDEGYFIFKSFMGF